MTRPGWTMRRIPLASAWLGAVVLAASGCGPATGPGVALSHDRPSRVATTDESTGEKAPSNNAANAPDASGAVTLASDANPANGSVPASAAGAANGDAASDRTFAVEGPGGALRVSFDDLDLLKVLKMDPVTNDCVAKMPAWLSGLNGKPVRIRGYMKPGLLSTDIPEFNLVRDTGLCCFGPKGKIYDLIHVTLKAGTKTDYIELRPFDVAGTFRIEVLELEDDGTIFGLYFIDDAQIFQK
jgi:hypothetical protein